MPRLDGVRGERPLSLLRTVCAKLTLGRVRGADPVKSCCLDDEVLKPFAVLGSLVVEHDRSTGVGVGGNVLCLADSARCSAGRSTARCLVLCRVIGPSYRAEVDEGSALMTLCLR